MKKLLTVFVMLLLPIVASAQIDPCLGIDSNGLIFDANHNGFVATLGEPFDAPKLDNDYNVSPIVWTSSNPAVATVDDNGNVTLVGVGRTHIAATFDGNDQYKAAVAEYDLVVVGSDTDSAGKADPSLGISSNGQNFDESRGGFIATLGEPFNSLELSNPFNVSPIIWSSSNTKVATVDENGIVTIVGVGKTQITASFAGNDEYKAGQASYSLVVEGNGSDSDPDTTPDTDPATKIDPSLSINSNGQRFDSSRGFIATLGEPFNSLELGNPYNVSPIVWTSSNPAVAIVDGNGVVTLVGAGETQITASFAGNEKYKAGQASYGLVVEGNGSDPDPNQDSNPDTDSDSDTKIDPNLMINTNEHWDDERGFVATLGKPFNSPVLSNRYSVGPIEWTSSNPAVATVDAYGVITLVGVGFTQITATFAGNDEYKSSKAEFGLEVEDPDTETDTEPDTNTQVSGSTTFMITNDGTVAISHNEQSGDVVIEQTAEIDGKTYQVTAIAENAFKDNHTITSVTMPNGLTYIGDNAFYGCIHLLHVNLDKDVNRIGQRAFANIGIASSARTRGDNSNLTIICNAENLPQTDADNVFEGTDIAHATLRVPEYLVEDYKNTSPWSGFGTIESIPGTETVSKTIHLDYPGMLPQYISEDEKYTINELILSGKVNGTDLRLIREMAGCDYAGNMTNGKLLKLDMTDVLIYDGGDPYWESVIESMGYTYTFARESKMNVLGANLFSHCNKLQEIKLPQTITAIEDNAFSYAERLRSLDIPKYVKKIGGGVISNCRKIKLDVDPENEYLYSPAGSNAVIRKSDSTLVLGCHLTEIPENSVTTIGEYAFAYLGANYPGSDYFDYTSIKIPEGVKTIKRCAFEMSSFKNIELPEGLETIENGAFRQNIIGIRRMTIPSTVKAIGDSVFIWNNGLEEIVSKIKDPSQVKYGEFLFDKTENYSVLYVPKGSLAAYESSPYWGYSHFEKIVEGEPEDENSGTSISAILAPQPNRDEYFNLQGQRVETPTKGLYIKNGRKILIK